jgi:hypothetical protein
VRTARSLDYSEAEKIVGAVIDEALRRQQAIVVAVSGRSVAVQT